MDDRFPKQPLSMIANIERGKFSPRPRNDPQYYGGTTPFIQTGDIARAGRTIVSWSQTLNEKGLGVSRLFPKGTILMAIAANIGDVAVSSFETACPDSVVALSPENGIDHEWLFQTLKFSKPGFAALATQNAQANLSLEKIAPFKVHAPPLPEQRRIAEILRTWDEAIEKLKLLNERLERQSAAICRRIFESDYTARNRLLRVRKIFEVVSERKKTDLPLLAVMQDIGIVRREELDRRVVMPEGDISSYKVVRPGDFVISLRSFEGGLEYSNMTGLVSPAYTVLRPSREIESSYYRRFFKSRSFIRRLDKLIFGIRDGKQIAFRDFGHMFIPHPLMLDQRKRARLLDAAADLVVANKRQKKTLERQKRGLMQKLLTGEWRVNL